MSRSNLPQKTKFSVAITTQTYQNLIHNTLGDPERAKRFIATISSAVAVNPALQECDAGSILAGALLGERIVVRELALFNFENVDVFVKAGANGELNISLVAEHELRFHFGCGYPLTLFVLDVVSVLVFQPHGFSVRSFDFAFKGYKVELTELRGWGEVKAFTEQCAGED